MTILDELTFDNDTTGQHPSVSGNWFERVSSRNWTVETAAAIHGEKGLRLATGTSGFIRLEYTAASTTTAARVLSFYIKPTNLVAANTFLASAYSNTSSSFAELRINSSGAFQIRSGGVAVDTANFTASNGTIYRNEWKVDPTADTQELRIYQGESTTPLDVLTGAIDAATWQLFTCGLTASASGFTADYDTIRIADDWTGPYVVEEEPQIEPAYAYYGIAEDGSLMPLEVYGVTE